MKITNRDKRVLFFKNIFLIMIMAIFNVIIYRLFYCGNIFMFPGTLVIIFSITYWYLLLTGLIIDTYKLTSPKKERKGLFFEIKFLIRFFLMNLILKVNRYIEIGISLTKRILKYRLLNILIISCLFIAIFLIAIFLFVSFKLTTFLVIHFLYLFTIIFWNIKSVKINRFNIIVTIFIILFLNYSKLFNEDDFDTIFFGFLPLYVFIYLLLYLYLFLLTVIAFFKRKEVFHLWKSSHSTLILYQVCDYPPDDIADVVKVNYEDLIAYDTANKAKIKILHIILITILIITLGLIANKLLYLDFRSGNSLLDLEYQIVTATFVILNLLLILFLPHLIDYFSYKAELYQQFKEDIA